MNPEILPQLRVEYYLCCTAIRMVKQPTKVDMQ